MARERLTLERIRNLEAPAGGGHDFLWDTEAPRLAVRATSGAKSYIFESKLNRKTIRITIGDVRVWGLADARKEANRLQSLVDRGTDPRQDRKDKISEAESRAALERRAQTTVGEAWDYYLDSHERHWGERHLADHINHAQAGGEAKRRGRGETVQGVLYPLLRLRLGDISAQGLKDWLVEEAEGRRNNARQGFELFRAFWRWCSTQDSYRDVVDPSIVDDPDLRREVPARRAKSGDVLERNQLAAWFEAVRGLPNPVMSAHIQGLLLLGARRDEWAELRWCNVDFRWKKMWIKDKYEGEEVGRFIPLAPYLEALLRDLPRENEWVFSSPQAASGHIEEPRIPHKHALEAAGLPHVSIHGLRRSFASLAEWVEMPRGVIAQIMGHKPSATAERHYIRRPVELLGKYLTSYEAWLLEQAGLRGAR